MSKNGSRSQENSFVGYKNSAVKIDGSSFKKKMVPDQKTSALQMVDIEAKEYEELKKKKQIMKQRKKEIIDNLDDPKQTRSCANCLIF